MHEHDVNSEQGWERTTIERRKKTKVQVYPLYFHFFIPIFLFFWWHYFVVSLESSATLDKTVSSSAA